MRAEGHLGCRTPTGYAWLTEMEMNCAGIRGASSSLGADNPSEESAYKNKKKIGTTVRSQDLDTPDNETPNQEPAPYKHETLFFS